MNRKSGKILWKKLTVTFLAWILTSSSYVICYVNLESVDLSSRYNPMAGCILYIYVVTMQSVSQWEKGIMSSYHSICGHYYLPSCLNALVLFVL